MFVDLVFVLYCIFKPEIIHYTIREKVSPECVMKLKLKTLVNTRSLLAKNLKCVKVKETDSATAKGRRPDASLIVQELNQTND